MESQAVGARHIIRRQSIERKIEQQDIDARLAQKAKPSAFGVVVDELANAIFRQIPRLGNTGGLEESGLGRDIRIKAAGRRRHQVGRYRHRRVVFFQLCHIVFHAVDQRLVGRPEIGAAGIVGVVRRSDRLGRVLGIRRGRRRRSAMEIFVAVEFLADQRGAYDFAVAFDHAAVRLIRENGLGDSGHRQRIGQTGDQSKSDQDDDRRTNFAQHGSSP